MKPARTVSVLLFALTVLVCLAMAAPLLWMVATALKPSDEVFASPPTWLPRDVQWGNFAEAWGAAPFGRFMVNSAVTSVASALIQIVVALLMAYGFVRIPVPGRTLLFGAVLMTMMIPDELKLIPNYLLVDRLGWIDAYAGLIVPPAAHAFPVLVLTIQLRTIPKDLYDAAVIDGAGHFRALTHVALPGSRSIVAALFLIAFLGRWNDYLWPLLVTNDEAMRTLPVGLAYVRGGQEGSIDWPLLMAGATIATAPVVILFYFLQHRFTAGVLAGGLKS